jgi:cytochrome P450
LPITDDIESLGVIFVDPSAYSDPRLWHEKAARIRAESPILKVSVDGYPSFWAITTHADVLEIERNHDIFTNAPLPTLRQFQGDADAEPESGGVKTLVQMDGEEHRSHRLVVNDWFKPAAIKKLTDRVDRLAKDSVDQMADLGGTCDFMNDVAVHYPLQVIMAILGLPEADYRRMLTLTQEMFGAEDPAVARVGEDQSIMEVILDFMNYFATLTAERRSHPTDDLATVIAQAHVDGKPLPDMDTFGFYLIIATAGHDTTSSVIGGALLALLDHPEQLALLQENPDLMSQAADEFIRYVAPVKHFMRTCREPFTLRGVTFSPGDLVLLSYASATRDESVFADAQRLDILRATDTNHLGFGFGRHFCLGAHLARMEIRAFYKELLGRLDHLELAAKPTWVRANFVQGPRTIPVAYSFR